MQQQKVLSDSQAPLTTCSQLHIGQPESASPNSIRFLPRRGEPIARAVNGGVHLRPLVLAAAALVQPVSGSTLGVPSNSSAERTCRHLNPSCGAIQTCSEVPTRNIDSAESEAVPMVLAADSNRGCLERSIWTSQILDLRSERQDDEATSYLQIATSSDCLFCTTVVLLNQTIFKAFDGSQLQGHVTGTPALSWDALANEKGATLMTNSSIACSSRTRR